MASGGYLDADALIRYVKDGGHLNKTLSAICAAEGVGKNGVKSELQARIIEKIRHYFTHKDAQKFDRLKNMIYNPQSIGQMGTNYGGMASSSSPAARSTPTAAPGAYLNNGYNMGGAVAYRGFVSQSRSASDFTLSTANLTMAELGFKTSPFYKIEQQLGDTLQCEVMPHHRHTVKTTIKVQDHAILHRVSKEPNLRVMVFCAAEDKPGQNIAFPHQSEVKVNGGDIKANLRGLKSKPGSTRPVDITKELRLNLPAYGNLVEMTYALTSKAGGTSSKFHLAIYVVKVVPVTELVEVLKNGKRITEKSVLDDMVSKARDADIVATASVLSLKCPLSTLKIDLPCRSISCRHNQCFDATSYLQLQEQGPTWLCPICNNSAPFDTLAVDEYVKSILKSTSRSVDQVTIQPDGKWELNTRKEPNSRNSGVASASDDDDDLVEITKSGDSVKMGTPRAYGTPLGSVTNGSAPPSGPPKTTSSSSSTKRSISAVIDLTSSGDEDDEPLARPQPKRQQTSGHTPMPPVYRPPTNGY
ncbi:E3 SUMO-protein ligase [Lachnellula hyalina]|uniref:E3 SUMO-protein ligase n=1 Tax=Lachnellula hyalina TaxID=1316788 RepID=A0A8H8U313_9HELO|nr:E3 SUMO-protein ligase [Lachnellula hyalina]TVY28646.1 E3 SUMO-protein ligase [Lachnellula hyalina]